MSGLCILTCYGGRWWQTATTKSCTRHITCQSDNACADGAESTDCFMRPCWMSESPSYNVFYNARPGHNGLRLRPFSMPWKCYASILPLKPQKSALGQSLPFLAFDRKLMILNVRLMHNEWDCTGCEGSASREHLGQTKMPFLPWDLCPGTRCHQRPARTQLRSIQAHHAHSSHQSWLQKVTLSTQT